MHRWMHFFAASAAALRPPPPLLSRAHLVAQGFTERCPPDRETRNSRRPSKRFCPIVRLSRVVPPKPGPSSSRCQSFGSLYPASFTTRRTMRSAFLRKRLALVVEEEYLRNCEGAELRHPHHLLLSHGAGASLAGVWTKETRWVSTTDSASRPSSGVNHQPSPV